MQVIIIDYGSGNLRSALRAVEFVMKEHEIKGTVKFATSAQEIKNADKIILPGVGAFADCRAGLEKIEGVIETLNTKVIKQGTAFLGICVGMQLMAEWGLEKTKTKGFGWLDGEVTLLSKPNLKVPQMGWNNLFINQSHSQKHLLKNITLGENGLHAYFVHSYYLQTSQKNILATTDYGGAITAIVGKDNYIGTQFHPEKSQTLGKLFLANFLRWQI